MPKFGFHSRNGLISRALKEEQVKEKALRFLRGTRDNAKIVAGLAYITALAVIWMARQE